MAEHRAGSGPTASDVPPDGGGHGARGGQPSGTTEDVARGGALWGVAGTALGTVVGAVAHLRGTRPLHPQGAVLQARLLRHGAARSGVAWIDTAGEDDVLVRLSRSAGLPLWSPDVQGLALRHDGRDLLLSTTGSAPGARHILRPQLTAGHGTFTSLLPFRGPRGPVLIGAQVHPRRHLPPSPHELADALRESPLRLRLVWAGLAGPWRAFGWLEIAGSLGPVDSPVRFEPLRAPAGLSTYGWVARLREPSYTAARRVPADPDLGDRAATVEARPQHHPEPREQGPEQQTLDQRTPEAPPVPLGATTTRRHP